jgi:hypothetical protein
LDHSKAEAADNDSGTENLGKIGECGEISHLVLKLPDAES